MIAGLGGLDIPINIGRDEAQRRAAEELAKAKYGGTPTWMRSSGERALGWLRWLVDLWTRTSANPGGGVNPVFVVMVLVVLAVIALIIWRVGLPRWRRRRAEGSLDLDVRLAAADYRTQAETWAREQNWAAACRERFRAVVRELEIRTVLDVRPARTASEAAYLASRTLPSCTEPLRVAAELFNQIVYGDRPADAESYAVMVGLDTSVTAAAEDLDFAAAPRPDRTPVGAS